VCVFVCSVWVCKQTASAPLYSINCSVLYIIETGSVFCAVRTKYLAVIMVILVSKVLKIINLLRYLIF